MTAIGSTQRLLPGVPLIESPIFEAELEASDLSPAEREVAIALNRNGYAVLDFPDPEFDARAARIIERLGPQFSDSGTSPDGVYRTAGRIQDAWIIDPDVRSLAANRELLDLLSRLYGRRAFPFQTLNFDVGTQQALHTDAVHFSSIPQRFMCGVWVALEDVRAEAGPLQYVPGTHRLPIMDNSQIGRHGFGHPLDSAQLPFQDVWNTLAGLPGMQPEPFLARKGQALIWCANLLHGGMPQLDPALTRWSQVTHYYFDDCIYYTPALSDEYLGRLQLRNLVSVEDGSPRPNLYVGEEVQPYAPACQQTKSGGSWLPRWMRKLVREFKS